MGVKTAGVGHFQIPTAPAAGTSITSGAANTYTTSAVQLIASTAAALYITGIHIEAAAASAATYKSVQLMIGTAGSETVIGQYLVAMSTGSTVALGYRPIFPPIPVANATRIAAKTADSVGAQAVLVTLECIAQSNVVDDGIAVGTVTTVTNQLTAAAIATGVWQDATAGDFTVASSIGKSLYIANVAPGAAGGHFISGSNAGTTTLGALTITGATTYSGNVVLSDGLTVSAPSTGNRAGITINGNGTGAAISLTGGATGQGMLIAGGATSGDGVKVTTTSGNGVNLAPLGTNMHGLLSTGGNGGTSDGIKAVAGTGGVDIRGNITGNLVGTVSTLTTYTGNTPQTGDSFARIGALGAGLTALGDARIANLDAAVTSRMASYTQPTGFLAATFPGGTIANTTNITAGTIANVTTVNGLAAGVITAASIAADAITDAKVAADVTIASVTGAVGSVTGAVGSVTGSVGSVAAGGIVAASFAANAINAAKLDPDVTTELQAGLATAASIAALNNLSAAQVNAEADTALADVGLTTTITGRIDAAVSSRMATYAQPAGFLAATFPTDPADQSLVIAATDAIMTAIAALNNLSAAQVNAEVVDALAVDTYAQPSSVPPATASLAAKLGLLHMVLRNRLDVTAGAKTVYDDAGVAIFKKTLSDDGTTYSETKMGAA